MARKFGFVTLEEAENYLSGFLSGEQWVASPYIETKSGEISGIINTDDIGGVQTLFTSELQVSDLLYVNWEFYSVKTIEDNFNLTLKSNLFETAQGEPAQISVRAQKDQNLTLWKRKVNCLNEAYKQIQRIAGFEAPSIIPQDLKEVQIDWANLFFTGKLAPGVAIGSKGNIKREKVGDEEREWDLNFSSLGYPAEFSKVLSKYISKSSGTFSL